MNTQKRHIALLVYIARGHIYHNFKKYLSHANCDVAGYEK